MGYVLTTTTTTTVTVDVLSQLVNYTSLYHKLHTVIIVVVLNGVDEHIADEFVQTVTTKYLYDVSIGFIHVLQQRRSQRTTVECLYTCCNNAGHSARLLNVYTRAATTQVTAHDC